MKIVKANFKRFFDAGVKVVSGSDAGNPLVFHGPTMQQELELYVAAGVSAKDAIAASTRNAAGLLGQSRRFGTIEVGKDANVVVIDGDPLRDIKSLSRISLVYLRGEQVGRARLLKDEEN